MFEQKKYEEALEKAKEAVQCKYLSDTTMLHCFEVCTPKLTNNYYVSLNGGKSEQINLAQR